MSRQSDLRAVVFDLDGLMFNTELLYRHVGATVLARRGCELDSELLDRMMGRPGAVALQIMIDWHRLTDTVEQLAAESEVVFDGILAERLETTPGLPSLLEALEAHAIPKAIATSSGRRFTERVLGQFALQPRFAFLLTAEDVRQGKPDPEVYCKAATRLGVAAAEMMVLEDSQNGCAAAVAAGAFTVAVPGDHSRNHDFSGAAIVATSLADGRIYAALGIDAPPAE
jgi:HAD superfamily hydrolase (TIGR01509 family)